MVRKKSLPVLLTTLALALLLAACESTPNGNPTPPPSLTATVSAGTTAEQPTQTSAPTPAVVATPQAVDTPTSQLSAQATGTTPATMPTEASATAIAGQEQPVAPEKNPPGDIPDTQAFVKYSSSTGGYELDVPEGWARTENGPDVSFIDKLDGVTVSITDTSTAPTSDSVRTGWVVALQQSGHAVKVASVKDVQLPSGPLVLVEYTSNSEPNAVTGKQVRLENKAYLFYKNGKLAVLTLWAPLGADNVDQWQRMSQSFKWLSK